MKNGILKRRLTRIAGSASAVILLGSMLTGCKDDLLTGMPDWLGSSIYEELESRGNFTQTLRLINDLDEQTGSGYARMLGLTGSKTLFVANDASWDEFYKSNPWGVKSFEDLTLAQKKLLFKSNMINSAYLVELLGNIPASSSTSDPLEGSCMRRHSSVDLSDSIPVIYSYQFPAVNPKRLDITDPSNPKQIDWWAEVRDRDTLKMFMDNNVATMIHFMPKFMQNNNITDDDVTFMTNGGITSNEEGFVNGRVINNEKDETGRYINRDVTCQNGYIHVTDGVPVPMDNMANVIATKPKFSMYSRLLDRFSYPYYDATLSARYGDGDSVFVKRYFNNSQNHALSQTIKGDPVSALLPYDPGWNEYVLYSASGTTYQYDAAMMLVPTDDALKKYLDTDGSDLRDRYGTPGTDGYDAWDNAPDAVVLPLMQNTMHVSLKSAIPSTFSTIMNSASESMGVTKADIDSVHWACNGVIYETNKVYVAPEYVSVFYPCVIRDNDDLHFMYTTINNDNDVAGGEGFKAYLNNMGTQYSFVIPTDKALERYYDPVSFNRTTSKDEPDACAYVFKVNKNGRIDADAYHVDWENLDEYGRGFIDLEDKVTSPSPVAENKNSKGSVFNRMKDIINGSMAMGLFVPGQRFYQSKAGGPIVVDWEDDKVVGIAGSFQYERGYFVPVIETFDKSANGNGRSYIIDEEPLQSTTLSPYAAITDPNREEFQAFASLLEGCSFIGTDDHAGHTTMNNSLTNLANYHYTIYIPKSESIQQLIDDHQLPTSEVRDYIANAVVAIEELIDELENEIEDESGDTVYEVIDQIAELKAEKAFIMKEDTIMMQVMENFVSYHIQDNAVYIDGEAHNHDVYESACLDTATTRFAKLYVDYTPGGQMKITDNKGLVHTVDSEINNILTRQYYFNGANLKGTSCTEIYSSAYAVIHMIDSPMMPFKDNDPKHPNNGYYNPATYDKVMEIVNKYYTEEPVVDPVDPEQPADPSTVKRHKR